MANFIIAAAGFGGLLWSWGLRSPNSSNSDNFAEFNANNGNLSNNWASNSDNNRAAALIKTANVKSVLCLSFFVKNLYVFTILR